MGVLQDLYNYVIGTENQEAAQVQVVDLPPVPYEPIHVCIHDQLMVAQRAKQKAIKVPLVEQYDEDTGVTTLVADFSGTDDSGE